MNAFARCHLATIIAIAVVLSSGLANGEIRVFPSTNVKTGDVLTFNGTLESDMPDYKYFWDFGDGGSIQGKNVTHIYKYAGKYDVKLKVKLGDTLIRSDNVTVTVEDRPENPLYVAIALAIVLGLIFTSLAIMVLAELKERRQEPKNGTNSEKKGEAPSKNNEK